MSIKTMMKKVGNMDRKKLIIIVAVLLIVIIASICIASFAIGSNNKGKKKDEAISTTLVTRGNVETTITGSGSLEPFERYEVIPLVNGEIIYAPFEVGDYVEEGAVVYEFDKTDAQLNL